jgi:tetratricopeptide (TPR) repeat protein
MSLLEAVEHHRAGRLAEALPCYEQALQADPANADAWHLLGNAVFQLGNGALAVELIGKACALLPNNPVYLLSLGMAQRGAGDLDASQGAYAAVLTLEPDNASAYFGMGNTLQALWCSKDGARP